MRSNNFFDNIVNKSTPDISNMLKAQVDITWPQEVLLLEKHGLEAANTVLDLGTGNGYFACRLAERYPQKNVVGIDKNIKLLKIANKMADEKKLTNIEFVKSECPNTLDSTYDFIFSRFVLYCCPNREEILQWAHDHLNVGGHFCAITLDDRSLCITPPNNLFNKYLETLTLISHEQHADREIAKKIPSLLKNALLDNIRNEKHFLINSTKVDPKLFQYIWTYLANHVQESKPDSFTDTEKKQFQTLIQNAISNHDTVIHHPLYFISGKRRTL